MDTDSFTLVSRSLVISSQCYNVPYLSLNMFLGGDHRDRDSATAYSKRAQVAPERPQMFPLRSSCRDDHGDAGHADGVRHSG